MMRRLAAVAALTAALATALATASPASATTPPGYWDGDDRGATRLSFDAAPEPAWAGKALSLAGRLSVACEEDYIDGFVVVFHADDCSADERWHRLGWKKIVILFRPAGSHRWEYVDTLRTDRWGSFYTEVPAYTSGTWRAIFEGSHHLRPSEARDWVKVIRH
ncbi:hypothetical protein [Thermoactinospora rubra]|uniref:hypothetical protein n=1 Tax=Thermoactinospora rubra TaxID=1088767 RepID=UPI000A11EEF5|nr:hypothetical protein [Thermoactinospora rubra]